MDSARTVHLLSPAKLSGQRGKLILNPKSDFPLARDLRLPGGAPLGAVFSFISGLYFRGKLSYARAFARPPAGVPGALVMTAGGGLMPPEEPVTVDRLRAWSEISIQETNPHFTAPLLRHANVLLEACPSATQFLLLGSVASNKYTAPLLEVFGERLLYPQDFLGLGDMARGSLLLRATQAQRELAYAPVAPRR